MKYSFINFKKDFPTDESCLKYIFNNRFNGGCSRCQNKRLRRVKGRKSWVCTKCRYQFYPLKGTIFEKSRTPLTSWFYAIYLISQAKNGVSSKELQRHLGVTYKCAWRINKQIRSIMKDPDVMLTGAVEADETYIGGKKHINKARWAVGRGTTKIPVLGLVQRGGPVKAFVVPDVTRRSLMSHILREIESDSWLITDEWASYNDAQGTYVHSVIKHKNHHYVDGLVHTNSIEGFWAFLKRGIKGTHIHVSKQHLQDYVDFFCFQYSHRNDTTPLFYTLLNRVTEQ